MNNLLTLSDICEFIVDCEHKTAPLIEHGIPSVRTTDLKNGRIVLESCNRVSEETYKEWTNRLEPRPDDLILSREAPVGEVGIIPPKTKLCLGQRTVLIRLNKNQIVPRFLLYLFLTDEMRHELISRSEGSVVPHLNMSDIRSFPLPDLPPLLTQHAIAHILGSLDDKIELNRQMNETLEAMARAIFQSWFVDFVPVRAKVEGRDTGLPQEIAALFPDEFELVEGREVPRGWGVGIADDICEKISDGSHYSPKENEDGSCLIGTVKDMDDFDFNLNSCKRITIEDYEKLLKTDCKPKSGDVLLSKDGTMGIPHLCVGHQDLVILSSIAIFRPKKEIYSYYLYWFLKSEQFQSNLSTYSSGSVLTRMVCRDLKKVEILLPDEKILQKFLLHVKVLHTQIIQNGEQSRTLTQIRDALLPKLMSGGIKG